MNTYWKPFRKHPCDDGKARTVYVRGESVPFAGWMATSDTYFSCPAFVRVRGRRIKGFIGQCGDDEVQTFYPFDEERWKLD